jgi:hypothetical protein
LGEVGVFGWLLGCLDGCWATTRDKIQIRDGKKVIFPKGWKKINKGWKKSDFS